MKQGLCLFECCRLGAVMTVAIVVCGCSLPRYTVGLDTVMRKEINKSNEDIGKYRCTTGAHRGDSVQHMENTLSAIKAAMTNDAYAFIEFDVQYTADDKIVVFHDKSLRRLFKKGDKIGARSYEKLQELSGGQIASYKETMSLVKGKKLNIEIKSQGDLAEDKRLVDYIVVDIVARGIDDDVVISSISEDVVRYINTRYKKIATGQIFWIKSSTYLPFDALTKKLYNDIIETEADYLMLHVANLRNINDLLKLKPKGKTIMFWNFDDAMYLVHKNVSDRLWGDTWITSWCAYLRYKMRKR